MFRRLSLCIVGLLLLASPAFAQQTISAVAVASCGTTSNNPVAGTPYPLTMNLNFQLCDTGGGGGGGGGGGAVTAASGAYAPGSITDIGTGASPSANTVNYNLGQIKTTLGSPFQSGGSIGAGENHVGEVGGNATTVTVAQTVTASSAYTSGNAIGGLMTIANAARVTAGSGLVQSVLNYAKSAQTGPVDVFLFNSNPTSSTCTDKAAFVLNAADFTSVVGVVHITDWTAGNVASIGQAQTQAMPFVVASGTSLYACAVTRSTPTYTATSDVSFGFRILRN